MIQRLFLALLATASIQISAFAEEAKDYKILEVNGQPIMKSHVIQVWESLFPEGKAQPFDTFDDKVKMNVLRGIVSEEVIYDQANKSGIAETPEVKEKLEGIKKKIITQAFLDREVSSRISEDELKKTYDEKVKQYSGKREIRASHILVGSEDKARDLVKQLKAGKDFDALAKEASEDKATAAAGGDLGFFSEDRMVPEFSKAAFALKRGQISDPVKTDFGWHVIKITDESPVKVPSFDEVKDSLRDELKEKTFKQYIDQLVDSSNVKYFDAEGKPLEFTRMPDNAPEAPKSEAPKAAE
ncbi:MAG: peptidylprolyl isomerase [Rickettsiales bacterium]